MAQRVSKKTVKSVANQRNVAMGATIKKLANAVMKEINQRGRQPQRQRKVQSRPFQPQSTKVQQPVKRFTYKTTGTLEGPVKALPKKESLFYQRNGTCFRQESGGVVTDNDAIYIGHSTCPERQLVIGVCRSIIKHLFERAGNDIPNFEASPVAGQNQYSLQYWYRVSPNVTTQMTSSSIIILSGTYEQMSLALYNDIVTTITNGAPHEFGNIVLYYPSLGSGLNSYMQSVTLDLRQYKLYFKIKSVLKVQNTTLSNVDTGDPNRDTTEDVEANPIQGYIYSNQGKWANYLDYKDGRTSGVLPVTVANRDTGKIEATSLSVTTNELKKPPNKAWQFGCKNQSKVVLQPSKIKYSTLNFMAKMNFNTFAQKFALSLNTDVTSHKLDFGNVALFGFEKSLASRQANGSAVRVAWQIDNTIKIAGIRLQKPATNEIISIL